MVRKKEDASSEVKKKRRGRPKGSKDSKPRKKKSLIGKAGVKKKVSSEVPKQKKVEEAHVSDVPLEHVIRSVAKDITKEDGTIEHSGKHFVPSGMKIDPDGESGNLANTTEKDKHHWSGVALSTDRDLSVPPDILLQGKKVPKHEVEDILEEPEDEDSEASGVGEFMRPPVRTSLYRKLSLVFAIPAIILVLVVVYVTYARATVTVYPQRDHVDNYEGRVVTVREEPAGTDEVAGEIHEVTVGGEKTGSASNSVESEGVAKGFVTLVNETSQPYTLVATTRLLNQDNVLFRLKKRVVIPANGELKTEVYADLPGKTGDIAPSTFIIPGLQPNTRKVVYARSDESMRGGVIARGVVREEDISRVEKALREELVSEATDEIGSRVKGTWTGQEFQVDTMSRFVNVAPGEEADEIVVRLTLRVRSVSYDRSGALEIVVKDLKRGLTSDRELVSVDGDAAIVEVERVDPKGTEAALRIRLSGESSVSLKSPLFDAKKLKGLDLDAVRLYFEGIDGVERVDVLFHPFWLKRMPQLADHIRFVFEK